MASGSTLLAPGGRLVVVGSAGGRLEVGKSAGLERGWGVSAPFWGTRRDFAGVVASRKPERIGGFEVRTPPQALRGLRCSRRSRSGSACPASTPKRRADSTPKQQSTRTPAISPVPDDGEAMTLDELVAYTIDTLT